MPIKRIRKKVIIANTLHVRLNGLYNEIADMYEKYLCDDIKNYGFFISHVPSDGLCMHLNYDTGYILPLEFLNEYILNNPNNILDLETFTKLSI